MTKATYRVLTLHPLWVHHLSERNMPELSGPYTSMTAAKAAMKVVTDASPQANAVLLDEDDAPVLTRYKHNLSQYKYVKPGYGCVGPLMVRKALDLIEGK